VNSRMTMPYFREQLDLVLGDELKPDGPINHPGGEEKPMTGDSRRRWLTNRTPTLATMMIRNWRQFLQRRHGGSSATASKRRSHQAHRRHGDFDTAVQRRVACAPRSPESDAPIPSRPRRPDGSGFLCLAMVALAGTSRSGPEPVRRLRALARRG
jgi:hypothetical protein